MAKITLRMEADTSKVSEALANLKKEAQSLAGHKIDLGIDSKDAQAIAKAAKALADLQRAELAATREIERRKKAEADAAKAEARAQAEASKTARSNNDAAIAVQNRMRAEANASAAAERHATADANAAAATERRVTSENNLAIAQERTAQGETNLAIAQERTEQTANRLATEQERTARATLRSGEAAESASGGFDALTVAMGNLAARAVHFALAKITQGIREALETMKDVDTQLTNISKVSGITGKALSDMGERAYETASKYGVAADEYLSAVYTFQKAGLGPSAEAMGELAVKTMLVGDTTADVASQFLISANAAWKFGGDIERLGQLVDEADYINNNYATDLGKLSSGLPRVASIAAQAGMSAEETLAALGTITAVTQESGTKAATALRALILNIEGQIGTFVDDTGEEFEVTAESVKSMQGLMEKYAKAEVEAAKASGELINPMTAIKAIFEGMANSDLNDQELFQLLSGMGGKLRTNQLTALVQNYQLFDEMLNKIADSAGTADGEIALMMDSWERKTQVLKNTWTEFVADFVDPSTIKDAITGLTSLISGLDDLLFKTGSERTRSKYSSLLEEYQELLNKGNALTEQERVRLEWIKKQTDALREQAAAQANLEARNSGRKQVGTNPDGTPLYYEDAMYESLTAAWSNAGLQLSQGSIGSDEYLARLRDAVDANRDYYESLIQWRDAGADLSESQRNFIKDFEELEVAAKATTVDLRDAGDGFQYIIDQQGNIIAKTRSYTEVQKEAAEAEAARESERQAALEESTAAIDQTANAMIAMTEETTAGTEATFDLFGETADAIDRMSGSAHGVPAEIDAITEATQRLAEAQVAYDEAHENFRNNPSKETATDYAQAERELKAAQAAYDAAIEQAQLLRQSENEAAAEAAGIVDAVSGISFADAISGAEMLARALMAADAAASGISVGPIGWGFKGKTAATGTVNAPGGPTLVNELGPELISENGRAYIANGGRPGVVNLSRGAIVLPADVTKDVMRGGMAPKHAAYLGQGVVNTAESRRITNATPNSVLFINEGTGQRGAALSVTTGSRAVSGSGGKGGGGGSNGFTKKDAENLAKDVKDILANLDKQAKLANNEGDYVKEAQLYEQAQEVIKKMVDDYKRAGFSDTSDEVVDLLNKNYDYANKQLSLYKSKWDEMIKALKADTDQQKLANQLAEKQEAVDKAQEALANAQGQRTVRMYNAATGQWEWVADSKKITSAQESLSKAEEAYADEVKSQAIKELESMKDTVVDLNEVILGPALSSVISMAENSDEFQNFARALNAVYGVGSYLSSTEGSSNVISTADSHDTIYSFGNVTLTSEQASSMSVAELAQKLQVLKIS